MEARSIARFTEGEIYLKCVFAPKSRERIPGSSACGSSSFSSGAATPLSRTTIGACGSGGRNGGPVRGVSADGLGVGVAGVVGFGVGVVPVVVRGFGLEVGEVDVGGVYGMVVISSRALRKSR